MFNHKIDLFPTTPAQNSATALAEEQEKKLAAYRESTERRQAIVLEYAKNQPARIIKLLEEALRESLDPDLIFAINRLDDAQVVIEEIVRQVDQCEELDGDKNYSRKAKARRSELIYSKLSAISSILNTYSKLVDTIIEPFLTPDEKLGYFRFRRLISLSDQPFIQKTGFSSHEGIAVRKLANELGKAAQEEYYNKRLLPDDADERTTPRTLFNIRRVKTFLPKLIDDQERYAYLEKTKHSFLHEDKRAFTFESGKLQFTAERGFNLELEILLETYKRIVNAASVPSHSSATEKKRPSGRPKGTTKPGKMTAARLINTYLKLCEELDDMPTAQAMADFFKVSPQSIPNYLKNCGFNGMSELKEGAENKRNIK